MPVLTRERYCDKSPDSHSAMTSSTKLLRPRLASVSAAHVSECGRTTTSSDVRCSKDLAVYAATCSLLNSHTRDSIREPSSAVTARSCSRSSSVRVSPGRSAPTVTFGHRLPAFSRPRCARAAASGWPATPSLSKDLSAASRGGHSQKASASTPPHATRKPRACSTVLCAPTCPCDASVPARTEMCSRSMHLKTGAFSRLSHGYLGRGPLAHLTHSRCEASRFLGHSHELPSPGSKTAGGEVRDARLVEGPHTMPRYHALTALGCAVLLGILALSPTSVRGRRPCVRFVIAYAIGADPVPGGCCCRRPPGSLWELAGSTARAVRPTISCRACCAGWKASDSARPRHRRIAGMALATSKC